MAAKAAIRTEDILVRLLFLLSFLLFYYQSLLILYHMLIVVGISRYSCSQCVLCIFLCKYSLYVLLPIGRATLGSCEKRRCSRIGVVNEEKCRR